MIAIDEQRLIRRGMQCNQCTGNAGTQYSKKFGCVGNMPQFIATWIVDRCDRIAGDQFVVVEQFHIRQRRNLLPQHVIQSVKKVTPFRMGGYAFGRRANTDNARCAMIRAGHNQCVEKITDILLQDLKQSRIRAGIFLRPVFQA